MENAMELMNQSAMSDEQLDVVVGGCGGYGSHESHRSRSGRGSSSRGRSVVVADDINNITVDDINISADDGSQVFVTFVQDN
jgi:hypothetical protein